MKNIDIEQAQQTILDLFANRDSRLDSLTGTGDDEFDRACDLAIGQAPEVAAFIAALDLPRILIEAGEFPDSDETKGFVDGMTAAFVIFAANDASIDSVE